jgi:hypothetical protein
MTLHHLAPQATLARLSLRAESLEWVEGAPAAAGAPFIFVHA